MIHSRTMLALLLAGPAWGCPTAANPVGPAAVTAAHVDASRRGDRQHAARWLSKGARQRGVPWPDPSDVPVGESTEVSRHAVWTMPSGRRVRVQRGSSGWRIHQGVLGLDRASTPRQALAVLARVLRTRDYAALMQLLPASERARWSAERLATVLEAPGRREAWSRLAETLETPAAAGAEVAWLAPGQKARISVQTGKTQTVVVLIKEGDGWKVLDVTPRWLYTSRR